MEGYNKLKSLYNLINQGLNVHSFIATKDRQEIIDAVHGFDNLCTVRTDSKDRLYNLPFYIFNGEANNLDTICNEIINQGLMAIIANGRKYDDRLRYNANCKIKENGDFWIEYSLEKCTLREMYNFPMNCYIGNIDERIRDWVIVRDTDKRVDKREIKELISKVWEKGVYDKYLEISVYNDVVGMLQENMVFWQICETSKIEDKMFIRVN